MTFVDALDIVLELVGNQIVGSCDVEPYKSQVEAYEKLLQLREML